MKYPAYSKMNKKQCITLCKKIGLPHKIHGKQMTIPMMKEMFRQHKKMCKARGGILIGGRRCMSGNGILVGGEIPLSTLKRAYFDVSENDPDFNELMKVREQFIDDVIKKAPGLKEDFYGGNDEGLVAVDFENMRMDQLKKYHKMAYDDKCYSVDDFEKVASWWKKSSGGKIPGIYGGELMDNIVTSNINNNSNMAGASLMGMEMSGGGMGCACCRMCGGVMIGGVLIGGVKKKPDNFKISERVNELEDWFVKEIKKNKHKKLNLANIIKLAPKVWTRAVGPFLRKRVLPVVAQAFPVLKPAAEVVKVVDQVFDMTGKKKIKGGTFFHNQLGINALKLADLKNMEKLFEQTEKELNKTSVPKYKLDQLRKERENAHFDESRYNYKYGGNIRLYEQMVRDMPKTLKNKLIKL